MADERLEVTIAVQERGPLFDAESGDHAVDGVRVERMMELHGVDERKATELIDKSDSGRARLLKRHFRVNIDDPLLYDAVWNTATASFESIAESIIAVLRERAGRNAG